MISFGRPATIESTNAVSVSLGLSLVYLKNLRSFIFEKGSVVPFLFFTSIVSKIFAKLIDLHKKLFYLNFSQTFLKRLFIDSKWKLRVS